MLKKKTLCVLAPCAGHSWKAFKGWSSLEGLQRLVLPGRPLKAGPAWKAFKGWSFLEGLQRLVLPGRTSKAGPSFKGWSSLEGLQRLVIPEGLQRLVLPGSPSFKGWSSLEGLQRLVIPEGLQRLVLPGRPSKAGPSFKGWSSLEGLQRLVIPEGLQRLVLPGRPSKAGPSWKAFTSALLLLLQHSLLFFTVSTGGFPSSSSRNRIFFAPLPQQARVPPKRERKRKYVTPARKVFCFQNCPPCWCQAKTRSEFAHSIGLDCQEPARCQRQNPYLPPATSSRVHPQDPQGVQVLVSPWQSLPAPARPSINA